jgi:signal transduction histidine kinase
MSHENATQKLNLIGFISYGFTTNVHILTMKAAIAKAPEGSALEDLGRATLRIVHDLKNQLNGLKLYATYLRKRLDRDDRSSEERETLAKLIAGLDRAARDMTALVRYARPIELRRQQAIDLRKIILSTAREAAHQGSGPLSEAVTCHIEPDSLLGEFDPHFLAEAFNALTHEAIGNARSDEPLTLSLHARRVETNASPEALIEWRGINSRPSAANMLENNVRVYGAFAENVITAHGGRLEFAPDAIRVSLPLAK